MNQPMPGVIGMRIAAFFPIDIPDVFDDVDWSITDFGESTDAGPWRAPKRTDDLALQLYGHNILDGLLHTMPTALLEAVGDADLLRSTGLSDEDLSAILEPRIGDGPVWPMAEARISIWNVGIALAVFVYDLPIDVVSRLSDLAPSTRGVVYEMLPDVTHVVRAMMSRFNNGEPGRVQDVNALWGNAVYLAQCDPTTDTERRWSIASVIATDGLSCPVDGQPAAVIRVARHCCVVSDTLDDPSVNLLIRLAGAHQVCWGAALLHDARLSEEIALIQPNSSTLRLTDLERQADRILASYHRVRLFRLRYASVEAHLDPAASKLWNSLEVGWKFELVLSNLDDRLNFVQTLHQQLSSRLQDRRSRLLNDLVLGFTFLNIFGIMLAAMTFGALRPFTIGVGTAIAMSITIGVNFVAYLIFRQRIKSNRGGQRARPDLPAR